MDELIPLPPGDSDKDLARRLGENESLASTDAFQRALMDYRDTARSMSPPPAFSEGLWARIALRSGLQTNSRSRVIPLWVRLSAATAAVFLVALSIWRFYPSGPVAIASALDASTTITLGDGSLVTLRPHSTLYKIDTDRYTLTGEAFFDVVHEPSRQFRLGTTLGEVRVLGTRFDVRTWGNETGVFLQSGRVIFRHFGTGLVDTLAPGEELVARTTGLSLEASRDQEAGSLDWMTGSLVFGERPLERIIAEVEHHFDIAVLVPDSLKTETLSGRISLASTSQSLNDLATVLRGRFKESQPGVFTFIVE